MEYDFYTLGVLYLVYSFAGWVGETVVATVRGKHFANRGAAAGPFCFVYGSTAVLLAVGFTDLRSEPVYLFFACTLASTVMEWLTAKLLERLHRRKWWDYSGKRFNLNGYVCLQYSLLWGVLGTASVLWLNGLLLRLCQVIPSWLLHPLVWAAVIVAALDQIGSAVLVGHYAAKHPVLEQLNQRLGESSDGLRRRIALYVEKRIQRAYPAAARQEPTIAQNGETPLSAADLLWLFVVGAFLGDLVETVFCRLTAGVWMSRSSLVWGPFSVVWGLALALTTVLLRQNQDKSDRYLFVFGTVMGGVYEYVCSAVTELLFGTGGMPSSHTAAVCALTVACGMSCGLDSPVFAVSLLFTVVVMRDATGVRREAGEQAKVLNRIVRDLFTSSGTEDIDRNLKELIGHTPLQVFVGAVVGAVVPFLMCLIPYYRASLIL